MDTNYNLVPRFELLYPFVMDFLPPVPQLQGEFNFMQWRRAIVQHSDYYGLKPYFDGTAIEPPHEALEVTKHAYRRKQAHAMGLLLMTTDAVEDEIDRAG